jgi:hypothetical protein
VNDPAARLHTNNHISVGGNTGGVIRALKLVVTTEGVGSLYRGMGPGMIAMFPKSAMTYGRVVQVDPG